MFWFKGRRTMEETHNGGDAQWRRRTMEETHNGASLRNNHLLPNTGINCCPGKQG
jgi:hypothetical protein